MLRQLFSAAPPAPPGPPVLVTSASAVPLNRAEPATAKAMTAAAPDVLRSILAPYQLAERRSLRATNRSSRPPPVCPALSPAGLSIPPGRGALANAAHRR